MGPQDERKLLQALLAGLPINVLGINKALIGLTMYTRERLEQIVGGETADLPSFVLTCRIVLRLMDLKKKEKRERIKEMEFACTCGHEYDEHGGDAKYPGSSKCSIEGCDCVCYESNEGEDDSD